MAAFYSDAFPFGDTSLKLSYQDSLERLAKLVALEALEQSLFDDPIAQQMPPTWCSPFTLGPEKRETNDRYRSRTRVAEPFKSPASLILSEVDAVWSRFRKRELPLDMIAVRTRQVVKRQHERHYTGTIQDWLPACVAHVVPAPRRSGYGNPGPIF